MRARRTLTVVVGVRILMRMTVRVVVIVGMAVLVVVGRILALDTPDRLQASMPGSVLEVRTDDPRAARNVLREYPGVRRASLFGESVHAVAEEGTDPALVHRALESAGLEVRAVRLVAPTLEDVFIARIRDEGRTRGEVTP